MKAAEMLLRFRAARKPEVATIGMLSLDEMSDEQLRAGERRAMHLVAVLEGWEEPTDDEARLLADDACAH